jgi:hypothetical protein
MRFGMIGLYAVAYVRGSTTIHQLRLRLRFEQTARVPKDK